LAAKTGDFDQRAVPGAADRGGDQRQPHHQRLQQPAGALPHLLVSFFSTQDYDFSVVHFFVLFGRGELLVRKDRNSHRRGSLKPNRFGSRRSLTVSGAQWG